MPPHNSNDSHYVEQMTSDSNNGSGGIGIITGLGSPAPKGPTPAVIVRGEMGERGLALTPFQDSDGRLGIRVELASSVDGVGMYVCGTIDAPADTFGILAGSITAFGRQA